MTAATAVPPTSARRGGEVAPAVLTRAKAGDPQAFTEVVRHYDHRLRALAYRLLGDRAAMDDALQEAYVKAFRALPDFREDAGLGTWLYQITYRACVDLQRREGRHDAGRFIEGAGPSGAESAAAATASRADPATTAAVRADLQRALAYRLLGDRAAMDDALQEAY
ncbi:MAG TPA: sigma-70 family RNA polymerase sigma factor, partial [Acidimicrobiia bacterium]|nr:sigma-70 family RNA polymerase sigma factor [Acidimicrobiia bacterium]